MTRCPSCFPVGVFGSIGEAEGAEYPLQLLDRVNPWHPCQKNEAPDPAPGPSRNWTDEPQNFDGR